MADFDGKIDAPADWADIPSLSTDALALGGPNGAGTMNAQAVALVARIKHLKEQAEAIAAGQGAGVIGRVSKVTLDASLGYIADTVAYVTNDATATNNGIYIKTGAAGSGSWTKSVYDPANQVIQLGQLLRNQGANFPFKPMVRDGISSAASNVWNNFILDVKVFGAKADKYYQIAYQQNEGNISGNADFGWIIYEYPSATFATSSVTGQVIVANHSDTVPNISRTGGIQTISWKARTDIYMSITVDASKLPASGTPIAAHSANTQAAWSWIIDPSCYVLADALAAAVAPAHDIAINAAIAAKAAANNVLLVNSGVAYPLRQMTRGGITSPANTSWNNLILNVRVIGAREGEYYQIAYQQNEALLNGANNFSWIIKKFDSANFETAPSGEVQLISTGYAPNPTINRAGGIQTIRLYPFSRPEMRIDITIDASKLPATGITINSNSADTYAGWSWIIDPSCYVMLMADTEIAALNELNINSGNVFPLRTMARNGETSTGSTYLNNLLLKMRVINAQPGYYYGIRYFKNGVAGISGGQDGWDIERNPIADYATGSIRTAAISYADPAPDIDRAGGIQTIHLTATSGGSEEFYLTVDPAGFPAFGTPIKGLFSGEQLYSWIIDPSCYEYASAANPSATSNTVTGLNVSGTAATKNFSFVFPHGETEMMRVKLGANGFNGLFNLKSTELAPVGDPGSAAWTPVNSYATDWFPPMVVQAVNNGDGQGSLYTGGNHGSNGDASGSQTAHMIEWRCEIDGKPLAADEVIDGYCDRVTFRWVNELCAYNTISAQRYVLRQTLVAHVHAGDIETFCDVTALEPIIVKTDNGPQMVTTGYQETCHFFGGIQQARIAFADALNSGQKSLAPNAWADVCGSAANGYQISWMNRSYGIGDGRYVGGTAGYMRQGGSGNTKHYHAAVASYSLNMVAGDSYQWNGGYAWAPNGNVAGTNLDCTFTYHKFGKPRIAYAFIGAGNGVLKPIDGLIGVQVGADEVIGPTGLKVTASGYDVQDLVLDV